MDPKELLLKGGQALGLNLSPEQLTFFAIYLRELIRWNKEVNLTTLIREEEIVIKHFLDSLSCLLSQKIKEGLEVIDIGTGAGLPGIPLKIAKPGIRLTLLDSSRKRMRFLSHLTKEIQLEAQLVPLRSEEFAREQGRNFFDLVLARALSSLPVLLEYALPLMRIGGHLIAQKGPKVMEELDSAQAATSLLGGEIEEIREVKVPFLEDKRYLVLARKIAHTPGRYPRKAGIPAKRPLGIVK